jgi:hypothetical protein
MSKRRPQKYVPRQCLGYLNTRHHVFIEKNGDQVVKTWVVDHTIPEGKQSTSRMARRTKYRGKMRQSTKVVLKDGQVLNIPVPDGKEWNPTAVPTTLSTARKRRANRIAKASRKANRA